MIYWVKVRNLWVFVANVGVKNQMIYCIKVGDSWYKVFIHPISHNVNIFLLLPLSMAWPSLFVGLVVCFCMVWCWHYGEEKAIGFLSFFFVRENKFKEGQLDWFMPWNYWRVFNFSSNPALMCNSDTQRWLWLWLYSICCCFCWNPTLMFNIGTQRGHWLAKFTQYSFSLTQFLHV